MNIVAFTPNFFVPGVGSIIAGELGQGITQIVIFGLGILLSMTVILSVIGYPMMAAAWIWGLFTAATMDAKPMDVTVVHRKEGP